jgi:hypothetical protein
MHDHHAPQSIQTGVVKHKNNNKKKSKSNIYSHKLPKRDPNVEYIAQCQNKTNHDPGIKLCTGCGWVPDF